MSQTILGLTMIIEKLLVIFTTSILSHRARWKNTSLLILSESQSKTNSDENTYTHACKYKNISNQFYMVQNILYDEYKEIKLVFYMFIYS
jgi:hypothetical protein